jgi:hypothetical protein
VTVRGKAAAIALAVVLVGCTKPETRVVSPPPRASVPKPPAIQAPVRTDRSSYQFHAGPSGPEATIVTTFTAPPDKPVYLENCNGTSPVGLQRLVGDQWVNAWAVEMSACYSEPIVIPAGKSHTRTVIVAGRDDAAVASRGMERAVEPGTYRAVWHGVLGSFDRDKQPRNSENLPLEQRVSAPFTIEGPAGPDSSSQRR